MKFYTVIAFLALVAVAVSQHQITQWGYLSPTDTRLLYTFVTKKSSLLQVVTTEYPFPQPGQRNNRTITYIRVTDQMPRDKQGSATLTAGGIGFNSTTVRFKSSRGNKIDSILEVFVR